MTPVCVGSTAAGHGCESERRRLAAIPLRWRLIGLVTLGTILNYLARSTLPLKRSFA